jgi:hypothetical protein
MVPRSFDQMFVDLMKPDNSLLQLNAGEGDADSPYSADAAEAVDASGNPISTNAQAGGSLKHHTYLAQAFLVRSPTASISDVTRNIVKLKASMRLLPFNDDAFKIGICSHPPVVLSTKTPTAKSMPATNSSGISINVCTYTFYYYYYHYY